MSIKNEKTKTVIEFAKDIDNGKILISGSYPGKVTFRELISKGIKLSNSNIHDSDVSNNKEVVLLFNRSESVDALIEGLTAIREDLKKREEESNDYEQLSLCC